jgi:hypothetical protein
VVESPLLQGKANIDQLSPIDLNLRVHAPIHRRRSCLSPATIVKNRLYIGDDLDLINATRSSKRAAGTWRQAGRCAPDPLGTREKNLANPEPSTHDPFRSSLAKFAVMHGTALPEHVRWRATAMLLAARRALWRAGRGAGGSARVLREVTEVRTFLFSVAERQHQGGVGVIN